MKYRARASSPHGRMRPFVVFSRNTCPHPPVTPGRVLRSGGQRSCLSEIFVNQESDQERRQSCCVKLFAKMGLTVKIKLIRVLSIVQCWIALWLIVLGIVERARIDWIISGLGIPIWTGVWVRIYYVQM